MPLLNVADLLRAISRQQIECVDSIPACQKFSRILSDTCAGPNKDLMRLHGVFLIAEYISLVKRASGCLANSVIKQHLLPGIYAVVDCFGEEEFALVLKKYLIYVVPRNCTSYWILQGKVYFKFCINNTKEISSFLAKCKIISKFSFEEKPNVFNAMQLPFHLYRWSGSLLHQIYLPSIGNCLTNLFCRLLWNN